ncbi:threonine synthase [Candidatus Marinamargulisbacteria bacterium SCGC AG-439-L15]|nr:threonine synthase [Candidatus Marinamargulisbacteria bacterium SCGC AG-439-L15]
MKYHSTRSKNIKKTFSEVILEGLAADGGLFVPESIPKLDVEKLISFKSFSYADLAYEVMLPFVGDAIPDQDLRDLVQKTYTKEIFGSETIAPVEHLFGDVYLQDLSSGPSLAFKDMAMQFLGHLLDYELTRQNKRLCILGASSGDTVSAAEEALKEKSRIDVVMLTPKEGMSPFQKAQAGSILADNIYNLSVPGPFDTCQDIVKEINRDLDFKEKYNIGAVNSINWGRILAQIVYYVSAYLQLNKEAIDVVVPTGNFGNVLAAYYVKRMGVPIRKLIVATNENHVLHTFIQTGIYKQKTVTVTSSPSMDISKASNLERFLYDLAGQDSETLLAWMQTFETRQHCDLSEHQNEVKKHGFESGEASHENRQELIEKVYKNANRVIDPHTAAGIYVGEQYCQNDGIPMLCMETAKATKFESTVKQAIGTVPDRIEKFKNLESKETRFYDVDGSASSVKAFIEKTI